MVQHAGRDDQIELPIERIHALDRKLAGLEIREVVLALQRLGVIEARRADVDADDSRRGAADGVLRRLPRAASRHQDVEVGAIRPVRPEQMEIGAMAVLVAPLVARAIEIPDRWRIWMSVVERADRIEGL